jgi:hypothetical protein
MTERKRERVRQRMTHTENERQNVTNRKRVRQRMTHRERQKQTEEREREGDTHREAEAEREREGDTHREAEVERERRAEIVKRLIDREIDNRERQKLTRERDRS